MEFTFVRGPVDNHWLVELQAPVLNAKEQEQLAAFGGFLVDLGGDFSNGVSYTLPTNQVRVPTQLPKSVSFSVDELGAADAAAYAALWETTVEARLQAALTTWMSVDPAADTSRRTVTLTG